MNKFAVFRKENPVFVFRSYNIKETKDSVELNFCFSIPGLAEFNPGWSFPKPPEVTVSGDPVFERLVFSLGMAEAVSYWKAVCSPEFRVECGFLSESQKEWWKKLWYFGLGEFFYVNGITTSQQELVNIICTGTETEAAPAAKRKRKGCLIPIGGGKDSALTLETLKNYGMECRCYTINKRCSANGTVEAAGLPADTLITAQRKFDRSLISLNNKGYLNGHTPFSSVVAFSAEIMAYICGLEYIVLSNESSANESTVAGLSVNHQYSKSFEFECDFHEYEKKYLGTGISYFSFLRPLTEFQIAGMFTSHRKYLPVFRSCNLGSKVTPDIWCGECSKCLFVSLILSPFLSLAELKEIFGRDMLNDPAMTEYFTELIGQSEHKPFECVGSVNEVNLAVSLTINRLMKQGTELPFLLDEYVKSGLYHPEGLEKLREKFCRYYNEQNLLPEKFEKILRKEMERLL